MKSEVACVAASSLSTVIPDIKDTAPGYTSLFLYSPHVFPE